MITFTVPGIAQPKGSTRAVRRGVVLPDNPHSKPWQTAVAWTARQAIGSRPPLTGPIAIGLWFYFQPPKSKRRNYHTVKPDLDKLTRCALDALTGIVYADDSQVMRIVASKLYDDPPRAEFTIREV